MRKFLVVAAVASIAAVGMAEVLLDQIGPNTNATNGQGVYASQEFEAAYTQYNIAVIDDFAVPAGGRSLDRVEFVLGWWNTAAFNIGAVAGYKVQIYSSTAAAGGNLTGNVFSGTVAAGGTSYVPWGTSSLGYPNYKVTIPISTPLLNPGTYWIGVMPQNTFGTNGQTGVSGSTLGGGNNAYQANPTNAFGQGTLFLINPGTNGAYLVSAIPEPASLALVALGTLVLIRRR